MSEQTYLSLHTVTPKAISGADISKVLLALRVQGDVRVSRYDGPANDWGIFKEPWIEYPDYEVLGQIVSVEEVQTLYEPEKFLLISCMKGNDADLRARVVDFVHRHFPEEVKRDFYLNNLSVNFGPHDIFEATENSSGTLFAQTTFSVSIWGYRHPSDLSGLREKLLNSEIVKTAQSELASILGEEIRAVVYLA